MLKGGEIGGQKKRRQRLIKLAKTYHLMECLTNKCRNIFLIDHYSYDISCPVCKNKTVILAANNLNIDSTLSFYKLTCSLPKCQGLKCILYENNLDSIVFNTLNNTLNLRKIPNHSNFSINSDRLSFQNSNGDFVTISQNSSRKTQSLYIGLKTPNLDLIKRLKDANKKDREKCIADKKKAEKARKFFNSISDFLNQEVKVGDWVISSKMFVDRPGICFGKVEKIEEKLTDLYAKIRISNKGLIERTGAELVKVPEDRALLLNLEK